MYKKAAEYVMKFTSQKPTLGLVLGSGLGSIAELIADPLFIEYNSIPGLQFNTISGHRGRFVIGEYGNKKVIVMQGRFHYYEGYEISKIVLPIRVMKELGVENIIITNAAGGVNPNFSPGDLMLIKDHINFSGVNPLRGKNLEEIGPRFPDMTYAYDPSLRNILLETARKLDIQIQQGVYAMMTGPSYETPAEIKMLRILGVDAIGMSTVPEVITAVHGKMKVLGISCITNMAAGILDKPLSHEEVIETAERSKSNFIQLLTTFINDL